MTSEPNSNRYANRFKRANSLAFFENPDPSLEKKLQPERNFWMPGGGLYSSQRIFEFIR